MLIKYSNDDGAALILTGAHRLVMTHISSSSNSSGMRSVARVGPEQEHSAAIHAPPISTLGAKNPPKVFPAFLVFLGEVESLAQMALAGGAV